MNKYKGYLVFFFCEDHSIMMRSKKFVIKKGYYAYVGSCSKNCSKRVSRHLSNKKERLHWHIDYLSTVCQPLSVIVLPKGEKEIAKQLASFPGVKNFGNTDDKSVYTHLFNVEINDIIKLLRSKEL
ncbi:GIY-YIG nuclease family protein [Acidianus manzaensis]|uniref:Endonuclease n=1 Tax=Acidianus manzaensis TaxID=282676 RepID=A0A1W6K397_9CREN|nr:DUF123 domain-containing protein [Acidianus manzaensis]ARM77013.1 hypothetical protein B6F84_01695 [Acidianus manzaensis]